MPSFIETVVDASSATTYVNGVARLTVSNTGVALTGTVTGAGGSFSLVETKNFSAASGTQTFSGLAGDTDKQYMLEGELTVSTGSYIELYPNGVTTASFTGSQFTLTSGLATIGSTAFSGAKLTMPSNGFSISSGERFQFRCWIAADSRGGTFAPLYRVDLMNDATGGGGALRNQTITAAWTPKTALTSLGISSTAGTMTGRVSLYKISP